MLEVAYAIVVAIACLRALNDWRSGLLLCLLLDVLRDPVRKLSTGQPIWITLTAAALWLAVLLRAWSGEAPRMRELQRRYPSSAHAYRLLLLAICPAMIVSTVSYTGGWKLAGIGAASYLLPIAAVLAGYVYPRNVSDIVLLLAVYCLVNSVALTGTLLEFVKLDLPALGGIKMVWLRYKPGYTVELLCGFYRSPDVMGLHAAETMMFSSLLALRRPTRRRALWLALVIWSGMCLILCGRRKMIAMPFVLAAVFIWLKLRNSGAPSVIPTLVGVAGIAVCTALALQSADVDQEYLDYAQTTITDSGERFNKNVLGGAAESVKQAGLFGWGAGTATQGSYYVSQTGRRAWQEDGVSRIVAEFGLIGALLLGVAMIKLLEMCRRSLQAIPPTFAYQQIQFCLVGILAANALSFVFSHQAYSGDPCSLLFVSLLLGILLSGPKLAYARGVS